MSIELNKIYNEDCLEGMKRIPDNSIDLVLTDPPYLLDKGFHTGSAGLAQRMAKVGNTINDFRYDFDRTAVFDEYLRVLKVPNLIIFCSNKQLPETLSYFYNKGIATEVLVWQKTNPAPLCNGKYISDVEYVVYAHASGAPFSNDCPIDYKKRVYRSSTVNEGKLHPTQKPIVLIERYVELHSKEGQVVLDSFMGSGTTAIACIKHNRNFIGFELNEEYYNIALERIEHERVNQMFKQF